MRKNPRLDQVPYGLSGSAYVIILAPFLLYFHHRCPNSKVADFTFAHACGEPFEMKQLYIILIQGSCSRVAMHIGHLRFSSPH